MGATLDVEQGPADALPIPACGEPCTGPRATVLMARPCGLRATRVDREGVTAVPNGGQIEQRYAADALVV